MLTYIFSFMFIASALSFTMKRKHLLSSLLSLEFMIIALYANLALFLNNMMYENSFMMIFLTLSVCESALGLSILVSLIRTFGNDYFNTFNILW